MNALYAYMRMTDDLADDPHPAEGTTPRPKPNVCQEQKRRALVSWRDRLASALQGRPSHRMHGALLDTVQRYNIRPEWLFEVIDGVETDLGPVRMSTFPELERYCYRVASTVGLACVRIWGLRPGSSEDRVHEAAVATGVAFQLTNILRDLPEDRLHDRIYLPNRELEYFDCLPEFWGNPSAVNRFRDLLEFQTRRAKAFYKRGRELTGMLQRPGRDVFRLMMSAYEQLLERVMAAQEQLLVKRVRLGRLTKCRLLAKSLRPRWS